MTEPTSQARMPELRFYRHDFREGDDPRYCFWCGLVPEAIPHSSSAVEAIRRSFRRALLIIVAVMCIPTILVIYVMTTFKSQVDERFNARTEVQREQSCKILPLLAHNADTPGLLGLLEDIYESNHCKGTITNPTGTPLPRPSPSHPVPPLRSPTALAQSSPGPPRVVIVPSPVPAPVVIVTITGAPVPSPSPSPSPAPSTPPAPSPSPSPSPSSPVVQVCITVGGHGLVC